MDELQPLYCVPFLLYLYRPTRNAWMKLPEVLPRSLRLMESSPWVDDTDVKSQSSQVDAIRLHHMEFTIMPWRRSVPSSPRTHDTLHRMANKKRAEHQIPCEHLETLVKNWSEWIVTILRKRQILFAGGIRASGGWDLQSVWCSMTSGERQVPRGAGKGMDWVPSG